MIDYYNSLMKMQKGIEYHLYSNAIMHTFFKRLSEIGGVENQICLGSELDEVEWLFV